MTPADLRDRNFATVAEAAAMLNDTDPRTVRTAIAAGEIPGVRVGTRWLVPTAWLRQQLGNSQPATVQQINVDDLAERVADRLIARLAAVILGGVQVPLNDRAQEVSTLGGGNDRNGGPDVERIPA